METFTAIEKINSTTNLSIRDFENGNINLDDVMEEVKYLKDQITLIRQEMTTFLAGLATLEAGAKPHQIFEENVQRVTGLQKTLDDYVDRYTKLKPLLELVNRELDLKIPEKQVPSVKPPPPAPTQTTTATKKAVPKKRTYNKKNTASSAASTPVVSNTPNTSFGNTEAINALNNSMRTGGNGSEAQPILL